MGLTRRMFLKRGSVAVAMAGAATSMPLLAEVASNAPSTQASEEIPAGFQMSEAVVAHVRDLASGDIHLFVGERQVQLKDPILARAIFHASR